MDVLQQTFFWCDVAPENGQRGNTKIHNWQSLKCLSEFVNF